MGKMRSIRELRRKWLGVGALLLHLVASLPAVSAFVLPSPPVSPRLAAPRWKTQSYIVGEENGAASFLSIRKARSESPFAVPLPVSSLKVSLGDGDEETASAGREEDELSDISGRRRKARGRETKKNVEKIEVPKTDAGPEGKKKEGSGKFQLTEEQTALFQTGLAGVIGGANLLIAVSLASLSRTGCGLPPGPGGVLGGLEGLSYVVNAGVVSWSVFTVVSKKTIPDGPNGLLYNAVGLNWFMLAAIVWVFGDVQESGLARNSEFCYSGSTGGAGGGASVPPDATLVFPGFPLQQSLPTSPMPPSDGGSVVPSL
uniref:Uncharacterized protein n=1 Tax=Chromera velia CCMP2878 TaxID=1169474 RepID=A0A0G4HI56_9ALVE|eukprot:Cvel_27717.t1-p1 / transcript=Cvel_27717.t1 / gene=Cvel_27717 / organism=Chromera_velia_CCMP2878 / gene_product=hypothetical protein / transcript_product=hypothetical protein / location=Cvel_scaffold3503:7992-10783(+) / protein_length=314 / sequence_SO=supercontig / SO=protein_coding / is_pseudo=false